MKDMPGTVCEVGVWQSWIQLDGDCKVPLLNCEFTRVKVDLKIGSRVMVAVGDIHPYLIGPTT